MTTHQLPDGRWRAFESSGTGVERLRASATGKTRKQARAFALAKLTKKRNEAGLEPHLLTLGAYLDRWLDHMAHDRASAHTIRVYRSIVGNLPKRLAQTRLGDVRPLAIQAALDAHAESGAAPATVRKEYNLLHAALRQAVRWRLLATNPTDDVNPPARTRTEMQALDEAEAGQLLKRLDGTRYAVPALLAVTTGLRRGELLALRWSDVDFEGATLRVTRSAEWSDGKVAFKEPKTPGSKRQVALMAATVQALADHKRRQTEERLADGPEWRRSHNLVFPAAHGRPWHPATFSGGWYRLRTGVRFHDLRHTHATILLRCGTPVDAVAKRLGHATPTITLQTYAHVLEDADAAAVARLEDALGAVLA
jgi:integrase